MSNQEVTHYPNPTEKCLSIYALQSPEPAMCKMHAAAILDAGGFWARAESPGQILAAFAALVESGQLLDLHWRHAEHTLLTHRQIQETPIDWRNAALDALARYRHAKRKAVPADMVSLIKYRFPLLSLRAPWNTVPQGRWRKARERDALRLYAQRLRREATAREMIEAKQRKLAEREEQIGGYDAERLHRIAERETKREGPNAKDWQRRADEAARAAGIGSRYEFDTPRLTIESLARTDAQARADRHAQTAAIRRYRRDANAAARRGDAARAKYLRQQAADLNRISIDPTTGEHIVTHQPPIRPERGPHGGRRPGTGGARPGAGRKPLFAPAPPEPSADSVAHADKDVSAARRWSAHASYLAKHFTYVAATGELIGPAGKPLDLRHPVSTPIGALRPGLLIAALLHGTVTRRYALPRGSEASSRWPLAGLTVSVVDRERDTGPAQPGTPAHLLVPPAPRLRGLALELRP